MVKGFMFQHQALVVEENININMSNLTSASGEASATNSSGNRIEIATDYPQRYFSPSKTRTHDENPAKKRRNLPGNPDPEAEVIALSPKTLMATNRFICEICSKGFQRDQNLQLHKRGHNLPWKLKQRTGNEVIRKKVYVCPEPTCVHHEPSRALGDLTGIKKHFCRKHGEKKWKCDKCSKKYAVQSDWKAHSKTCGTREYRCDCGTLFTRRDSFITHRAFCDALAEESSRTVIHQPTQPNSHHNNMINLQTQEIQGFTLKKEHQDFSFLKPEIQIPSWLELEQDLNLQENPNPRNGPTTLPSYHQPSSAVSPHMSATALLQKAAQMGSTSSSQQQSMIMISGTHQHGHVSLDNSSTNNNYNMLLTSSNGNFHLNLSSCDNQMINNNSFSSSGFHGTTAIDDGGNDAFTRDFLGLRPLSDSDILSITGMGNCMDSSNSHNNQQNQTQKPWQGN